MKNKILIGVLVIGIILSGISSAERCSTDVILAGVKMTVYSDIDAETCYTNPSGKYISWFHKGGEKHSIRIVIENIGTNTVNVDLWVKYPSDASISNVRGGLIDRHEITIIKGRAAEYPLLPGEVHELSFDFIPSTKPYEVFNFEVFLINELANYPKYIVIDVYGGECLTNEDCKGDEICSDLRCKKIDCKKFGYDKPMKNHKCVDCERDSDCEEDEYCYYVDIDIYGNRCKKLPCGYCEYPKNHECVKYECCSDSDCNLGYECKNHECVLKVECTKDSQCSYDEKCSNYKCIKLSCGYCEHIENHECVKYECCDDSDCLSGYECKNHECVRKAVTTIPTTQSQGVPIWLIELVIIILLAIIAILLARRK